MKLSKFNFYSDIIRHGDAEVGEVGEVVSGFGSGRHTRM